LRGKNLDFPGKKAFFLWWKRYNIRANPPTTPVTGATPVSGVSLFLALIFSNQGSKILPVGTYKGGPKKPPDFFLVAVGLLLAWENFTC